METSRKIELSLLFPIGVAAVGVLLFLPAGTFSYWQAWVFLACMFLPFAFMALYLMRNNPALLERRMRFREKEAEQGVIVKLSSLFFGLGMLFPGFDHRFGWSSVPLPVVILADALILMGFFIVFFVFRENSYTSRVVEVEKGQKVISTGPYSVIRHPMYAGVIMMYIAMPVALGSFWGLLIFLPIVPLIGLRAIDEERVLLRDLKGYAEYTKKVKYRLIPGVW
jgi:protein-S-isoprenylcysteine O-methyltransferase Ste14